MPLRDGVETDEAGEILIMIVLAQELMVGPELIQGLRLQMHPVTRE